MESKLPSNPTPEFFTPPNGMFRSRTSQQLAHTVPACQIKDIVNSDNVCRIMYWYLFSSFSIILFMEQIIFGFLHYIPVDIIQECISILMCGCQKLNLDLTYGMLDLQLLQTNKKYLFRTNFFFKLNLSE